MVDYNDAKHLFYFDVTQPTSDDLADDLFDLPPAMPSVVIAAASAKESEDTPAPVGATGRPGDQFRFSAYAMDCWAVGATIYCFMYGVLPFPVDTTDTILEAYELLLNHNPLHRTNSGEKLTYISEELLAAMQELVGKLLSKDPAARLTVADALYFAKGNILDPPLAEPPSL
jgi:serine/threonine protein kinase